MASISKAPVMAAVYLSLSSNFKRSYHIKSALAQLSQLFEVLQQSAIYRNQSLNDIGEDYFNLVLELKVNMERGMLVAQLKEIENSLGRERGEFISAISIDIDLLCFESDQEGFVCSDIYRRSYLLRPFSEIAGDKIEAVSGLSYKQLWSEFDQQSHPLTKIELI